MDTRTLLLFFITIFVIYVTFSLSVIFSLMRQLSRAREMAILAMKVASELISIISSDAEVESFSTDDDDDDASGWTWSDTTWTTTHGHHGDAAGRRVTRCTSSGRGLRR